MSYCVSLEGLPPPLSSDFNSYESWLSTGADRHIDIEGEGRMYWDTFTINSSSFYIWINFDSCVHIDVYLYMIIYTSTYTHDMYADSCKKRFLFKINAILTLNKIVK